MKFSLWLSSNCSEENEEDENHLSNLSSHLIKTFVPTIELAT
jgi:hypothetical protein